jgi:hypothetical protein
MTPLPCPADEAGPGDSCRNKILLAKLCPRVRVHPGHLPPVFYQRIEGPHMRFLDSAQLGG